MAAAHSLASARSLEKELPDAYNFDRNFTAA
jgi:hypothetical protein